VKDGKIIYDALVYYGAWGRHGRVLQSGLYAEVLGDEILLKAVTSKGEISDAVVLRIPLAHKDEAIELLKSLD
jgi:hypothetical protein